MNEAETYKFSQVLGLGKVCRCCLSDEGEMKSMFEEFSDISNVPLFKMFALCTSLDIQQSDGLPQFICEQCDLRLSSSYDFRDLCMKSNAAIRKYISNAMTHPLHEEISLEEVKVESNEVVEASENFVEQVDKPKPDVTEIFEDEEEQMDSVESSDDSDSDPLEYTNKEKTVSKYSSEIVDEAINESKKKRNGKIECKLCGFMAAGARGLGLHMAHIHKQLKERWCNICVEEVGDLAEHTKNFKGKCLKCTFCEKRFSQQGHLTEHLRSHSTERPYNCNICNKGFLSSRHFKVHMGIHNEEKPYQCPICDRTFGRKRFLLLHTRSHNEPGMMYQCEMPQRQITASDKMKWSLDNLNTALQRIRAGTISIHKAAKEFKIPYSTLQRRLLLQTEQVPPRLGRKPVFTKEQEDILSDHLVELADLFYGLSTMQQRKIAFEFAENSNIVHTFNKHTKLAGGDWLDGFLKRNPQVAIRKPEWGSVTKFKGYNVYAVQRFYKSLEELMQKNRFEAHQIFTMAETDVTPVQDPSKVLGKTGRKREKNITYDQKSEKITITCCMSAAGTFVPPMFMFPQQSGLSFLENSGPPGAIYDCYKDVWRNEILFMKWLQHFKDFVKPLKGNKILLIMDNHKSHISLESFEFCRENHISVLPIPPYTSHRLQPLDVTFYDPLRIAFNTECDIHMMKKNITNISSLEMLGLLQNAYTIVATSDKGVNGFRLTGIYPLNPNILDD